MARWKKNLPNEHGGWVLLVVSVIVGVAANPGIWQAAAVTGWLGVFFMRVPLARLADGKRGTAETALVVGSALAAAGGFAATILARPHVIVWLGVAAVPGAILIILRKRKFMRSVGGELLAMFAMAPMLPSIARAGDGPLSTAVTLSLGGAMALYLGASVMRVRAVARMGRNRAPRWLQVAGAVTLPLVMAVAWGTQWWPMAMLWATTPAIVVGLWMSWKARHGGLNLYVVGIGETVAVIPFAIGMVIAFV